MKKSLLLLALLLAACSSSSIEEEETPEILTYEECQMAGGQIFNKEPHECHFFDEIFYENKPKAKFVDYGPATGYYASPVGGGPYPAVVLIHGESGLQKDIWAQARGLAKEGSVVLAVDLYEGEKTTTEERAQEMAIAVREDMDRALTNLEAAAKWLSLQYNVDKESIRYLGESFGEEWDKRLALLKEQL